MCLPIKMASKTMIRSIGNRERSESPILYTCTCNYSQTSVYSHRWHIFLLKLSTTLGKITIAVKIHASWQHILLVYTHTKKNIQKLKIILSCVYMHELRFQQYNVMVLKFHKQSILLLSKHKITVKHM